MGPLRPEARVTSFNYLDGQLGSFQPPGPVSLLSGLDKTLKALSENKRGHTEALSRRS